MRRVAIRSAVRQAGRERVRVVLERGQLDTADDRLPDVDLERAIAVLAPMQRAAVVLYYVEDQPIAEIARTLRVSGSTIKQRLFRARSRLAELLHEEVTEDVR